MTSGGKRALVVLVAMALLGLAAPDAGAAEQGAHMTSDQQSRSGALDCSGDPTTGPVPALLVHGTGVTAAENWSTTYVPAMVAEGRAVCTVSLPGAAVGDLQRSIEYVATAIRELNAAAGRRIAVIGHSQGAYLPRVALRVWPDLAARVDDVIGLAGLYDHGSTALVRRCATQCVPAMQQMATGSTFLAAIGRRALPVGPSYTNIGTLGDTVITPQPLANQQTGATAVEIQDVCPGRTIPLSEHGLIVGDAVAKALVDDALAHRGAAVASRVPTTTCAQVFYAGFVPNPFLEAAPFVQERLSPATTTEPALRCHLRTTCADVTARGRLLADPRRVVSRTAVTWTGSVPLDGRIRVTYRGTTLVRRVRPGGLTLRIDRPTGAGLLVLETRPDRYTAWAREDAVRLR